MVGGGAARAGGLEDEVELLADLLLADELVEVLGAQGGLDGLVLAVGGGADEPLGARRRSPCRLVVPVHRVSPRLGSRSVPGRAVRRPASASAHRSAGAVQGLQGGPQQLRHLRRRRRRAASACGATAATASSASRVA